MTITVDHPSEPVLGFLSSELAKLGISEQTPPLHLASVVDGVRYQVSGPYPVYNGTIDGVLEGTLLDSAGDAGPTAMTFGIIAANEAYVAEIVTQDGQSSLAALYPPEFAEAVNDALHRADEYDKAHGQDRYTLRVLRIPSLSLNALWLHNKVDRLAPIAPWPYSLEAKVYTERELTTLLVPIAERRRGTSEIQ